MTENGFDVDIFGAVQDSGEAFVASASSSEEQDLSVNAEDVPMRSRNNDDKIFMAYFMVAVVVEKTDGSRFSINENQKAEEHKTKLTRAQSIDMTSM